jgi:hypothetical protein
LISVEFKKKGAVLEGKGPEVVRDELVCLIYEVTAFLEREVKERTPRGVYGAQGGLASTIHGEVTGKGTPQVKGVVGHQSKYGDVIEKGRKAGKAWPPEGALIRWIEVKLGKGEEEAYRLEFVIRRKIGRKGFPGAHMFQRAVTEEEHRLQRMADRHGFSIVTRLEE